jgi:hypothetical protein
VVDHVLKDLASDYISIVNTLSYGFVHRLKLIILDETFLLQSCSILCNTGIRIAEASGLNRTFAALRFVYPHPGADMQFGYCAAGYLCH